MNSNSDDSKYSFDTAALFVRLKEAEEANSFLKTKVERNSTEVNAFKKILTESDEWSFILNNDGKLIFVSDSCLKTTGYKSDEILINPDLIIQMVNSHEREVVYNALSINNSNDNYQFLIINLTNRKGVEKKFSFSCFPLFGENGENCGKCIIFKEATDVFLSHEIVNRYERIVSATPDLISLVDKNYIYRIVNNSSLNFTGKTLDELVGKSVPELVGHETFVTLFKEKFDQCLKGHVVKFESWIYFQSAGKRYMSITYYPYYDRNNEISGIVASSRDITELKNAQGELLKSQQSLKELNAAKDKFFSLIAHDLRGPFTGLLGFTEMILNDIDELSKEEISDYVKDLHKSLKDTLELLQNLLEWARTQTGRIQFSPIQFNICDLILEVLLQMKKYSIPKEIEMNAIIDKDIMVFADEEMCTTILRNLITNAIKFSNPKSDIEISADIQNGKSIIKIIDKGIGISKERMGKLFLLSESSVTLGTDGEKGTGLGLILSKELAEINKGKLLCYSEEGKGTTFLLELPLM
ncbi:MAG: PAS domain-containing sensor histidine kinase [Ignavibacteria bacterium]|nr:PAS domain-containing sensor histidine kinase [Ignavibacteria bacterium]